MARDPFEIFADPTVSADLKLNEGQVRALGKHIAKHAEDGYSTTIGLADIGDGFFKVIFYDRNTGGKVDQELLFADYE
jgi:hypothetical protein